jgi:hypothetical protein
MDITYSMGQRGTARFELYDGTGTYRPSFGQTVLYYEGTHLLFAGYIQQTEEEWYSGTTQMNVSVACTDWTALTDRRVIGDDIDIAHGGILGITAYRVISKWLDGEGITLGTYASDVVMLADDHFIFNWKTVREALDEIAAFFKTDWWITKHKVLNFGVPDAAIAAPFAIEDDSGLWRKMRISRDAGLYRNWQGIRSSKKLVPLRTETFAANDNGSFITDYIVGTQAPQVTVTHLTSPVSDPVTQIVVELGDAGDGPYDFYYISGGYGVFRNPTYPPLAGTDTISVTYPSNVPPIIHVQDDAGIAEHGLWQHVDDVRDVFTQAEATAIAQGLLDRLGRVAENVAVQTDSRVNPDVLDLEVAQLMSINTTRPPLVGDFLVQSLSIKETAKQWTDWSLQLTDGQKTKNWVEYFERMVDLTKEPTDRILEKFTFALVEDMAVGTSVTNPLPAIKTGYALQASIQFETAPTGSSIIVDLKQNGTSIFGDIKLVLPAGSNGAVQVFFRTDPLVVTRGDVFTCDILQVGSTEPGASGTVILSVIA